MCFEQEKRVGENRKHYQGMGKERMTAMYIKVYTESQLELLRNMNKLLGRHKLPKEVLKEANYTFYKEKLGKTGFLAFILHPVADDLQEIQDILNLYPFKLKSNGDGIKKIQVKGKQQKKKGGKEWYCDSMKIKGENSRIIVFYSMRSRALWGGREEN